MKHICIYVGVLLAISLCNCQPKNAPATLTDDDYGIYSAYLDRFSFYKTGHSPQRISITDSTTIRPGDIHPETPWEWVTVNLGDNCKHLKDTVSCRKAKQAG